MSLPYPFGRRLDGPYRTMWRTEKFPTKRFVIGKIDWNMINFPDQHLIICFGMELFITIFSHLETYAIMFEFSIPCDGQKNKLRGS
jgi:hypothetical protein